MNHERKPRKRPTLDDVEKIAAARARVREDPLAALSPEEREDPAFLQRTRGFRDLLDRALPEIAQRATALQPRFSEVLQSPEWARLIRAASLAQGEPVTELSLPGLSVAGELFQPPAWRDSPPDVRWLTTCHWLVGDTLSLQACWRCKNYGAQGAVGSFGSLGDLAEQRLDPERASGIQAVQVGRQAWSNAEGWLRLRSVLALASLWLLNLVEQQGLIEALTSELHQELEPTLRYSTDEKPRSERRSP